MVWIYGGAFFQGSIADPRYNMSYIVKESVEAGHPVMTVAVNYRLAGFGFLFSQEVMVSDSRAVEPVSARMVIADDIHRTRGIRI